MYIKTVDVSKVKEEHRERCEQFIEQRKNEGRRFYLLLLVVLVGVIGILMEPQQESRITYSDVTNAFEAGQVTDFVIDENKLTMTLKNGSQFTYQLPSVEIFYADVGETIKEQREPAH